VIQELCQAMAEYAQIPEPEALYAAVRAREELMGTGIEQGVAIPHARLESLTKPMLMFGRSVAGVEWDAPDGLPAHFVFLVLTPTHDEGLQLQILAAIARAMGHARVRQQLSQAEGEPQLWLVLQDALRSQVLNRGAAMSA
jgi:mannitol/fructose-specific phosphotransferase system IIA component (Ntr-type)